MKKDIIKQLKSLFSRRFRDKLQRETTLIGLYKRLLRKQKKLSQQLRLASGDAEIALLDQKIRVLEAQISKLKSIIQTSSDEAKN